MQGPEALERLGAIACDFGHRIALVTDPVIADLYGHRVASLIAASGGSSYRALLRGEITEAAIADLSSSLAAHEPDVVVGMGGGKALDAAKAVSFALCRPVVTVPTSASNDGPTSACYAIYGKDHVLVEVRVLPQNPAAVLVDSEIIAKAPVSTLRAGIGDAIAKKFEADACARGSGCAVFGTRPVPTAQAIADLAYRTLRTDALSAMAAAEVGRPTPAFENVLEACFLMSGLAFENAGLSLAHSLTRGLQRLEGARHAAHGLQVAWGLLVQLAVEDRGFAALEDMIGFYRSIGLPRQLADLGVPSRASAQAIPMIAEASFTAPHLANFPSRTTIGRVAAAIHQIEGLATG